MLNEKTKSRKVVLEFTFDSFSNFWKDVLTEVFKFLSFDQLAIMRIVCKTFQEAVKKTECYDCAEFLCTYTDSNVAREKMKRKFQFLRSKFKLTSIKLYLGNSEAFQHVALEIDQFSQEIKKLYIDSETTDYNEKLYSMIFLKKANWANLKYLEIYNPTSIYYNESDKIENNFLESDLLIHFFEKYGNSLKCVTFKPGYEGDKEIFDYLDDLVLQNCNFKFFYNSASGYNNNLFFSKKFIKNNYMKFHYFNFNNDVSEESEPFLTEESLDSLKYYLSLPKQNTDFKIKFVDFGDFDIFSQELNFHKLYLHYVNWNWEDGLTKDFKPCIEYLKLKIDVSMLKCVELMKYLIELIELHAIKNIIIKLGQCLEIDSNENKKPFEIIKTILNFVRCIHNNKEITFTIKKNDLTDFEKQSKENGYIAGVVRLHFSNNIY